MSHAGLGLREEPLYKGTLGARDLGQASRPLFTSPYTLPKFFILPRFAYGTPHHLHPSPRVPSWKYHPSPLGTRPSLRLYPGQTPLVLSSPPRPLPLAALPPPWRSWPSSSQKQETTSACPPVS